MSKAETRIQVHSDGQYSVFEIADRTKDPKEIDRFLEISAELTGFSIPELQATGNAEHLFEELGSVIGVAARSLFLNGQLAPADRLSSAFDGPLARNVIRMWYLGHWEKLPIDWIATFPFDKDNPFDEFGMNYNRVISARAYRESLVWPAIGANPPAAKQPGFASWTEPPR